MTNPELRRYYWLELKTQKLLLLCAVLFLTFYLAYLSGSHLKDPFKPLTEISAGIFFFLAYIWGAKCQSESVSDEISEHTWDFQRMSPIGAWRMTWGKLLGCAIFPWIGAVICIIVHGLCIMQSNAAFAAIKSTILMLLGAVVCQCCSFVFSTHSIIRSSTTSKRNSIFIFVIAILIGSVSYSIALPIANTKQTIAWFGFEIPAYNFVTFSLLTSAAWLVLGAYRLMRIELQYQSGPLAWLLFVTYQIFYFSGFIPEAISSNTPSKFSAQLSLAFCIAIGAFYLMAATEIKSAVNARKLIAAYQNKNFKKVYCLLPRWLVTYLLAVVAGACTALSFGNATLPGTTAPAAAFVMAALLFALRDIIIFLSLNFSLSSARRADTYACVYLLIFYGLLPWITAGLDLKAALVLFYPLNIKAGALVTITIPLLEAAIAGWILLRKWRNLQVSINGGAKTEKGLSNL